MVVEAKVVTGVDRTLPRSEGATRSVVGAGLDLIRREGTPGVTGATVATVRVGIRSAAERAPEVDPNPARVLVLARALLLGEHVVVVPEAGLNYGPDEMRW